MVQTLHSFYQKNFLLIEQGMKNSQSLQLNNIYAFDSGSTPLTQAFMPHHLCITSSYVCTYVGNTYTHLKLYRNLSAADNDMCSNRTLTALYLCLVWHPIAGREISEFTL